MLITPNETQQLALDHFNARVNHEGHIYALEDGSQIFFSRVDVPEELQARVRPYHINNFTFGKLFELLCGKKSLNIVETGTSANAVDSSSLFDAFIRKYGGKFVTIDIDPTRAFGASERWCENTNAVTSDSAAYLKDWANRHPNQPIDVVYLDSWDIEWTAPEPSQQHGINEFNAILPHLADEAYILIDDTPATPEWLPFRGEVYEQVKRLVNQGGMMPGKGAYIKYVIQSDSRFQIIDHQYQLLLKFTRK